MEEQWRQAVCVMCDDSNALVLTGFFFAGPQDNYKNNLQVLSGKCKRKTSTCKTKVLVLSPSML